jgi:hypothetical protein
MSAQARRLVSGGPKKASAACQRGKLLRHAHSFTHSRTFDSLQVEGKQPSCGKRKSAVWGPSRGICIYHVSEPTARGEAKLTAQLHSVAAHKIHRAFLPYAATALGGNLSKAQEDASRLTCTFTVSCL